MCGLDNNTLYYTTTRKLAVAPERLKSSRDRMRKLTSKKLQELVLKNNLFPITFSNVLLWNMNRQSVETVVACNIMIDCCFFDFMYSDFTNSVQCEVL